MDDSGGVLSGQLLDERVAQHPNLPSSKDANGHSCSSDQIPPKCDGSEQGVAAGCDDMMSLATTLGLGSGVSGHRDLIL